MVTIRTSGGPVKVALTTPDALETGNRVFVPVRWQHTGIVTKWYFRTITDVTGQNGLYTVKFADGGQTMMDRATDSYMVER